VGAKKLVGEVRNLSHLLMQWFEQTGILKHLHGPAEQHVGLCDICLGFPGAEFGPGSPSNGPKLVRCQPHGLQEGFGSFAQDVTSSQSLSFDGGHSIEYPFHNSLLRPANDACFGGWPGLPQAFLLNEPAYHAATSSACTEISV